jgi:hypothetical protein
VNIYLGKQTEGSIRETQIGKKAFLTLCAKYFHTNRCLCADIFFSSIPLCQELWVNGIEYIGTLRANKIEIPQAFLKNPSRIVDTCLFAFKDEITITSFVPKKSKALILVSTKHHTEEIDLNSKKLKIILDYNKLKGL